MCKAVLLLSVLVAILIAETSCQRVRIIRPVLRKPVRVIIIRKGREAPNSEPLWLNQGDIPRAPATGDHPFLPKYIDDIKLNPERRYARSLDSPSAKRGGGSHSVSGSEHTGPTHPGYNRRHTRSIRRPLDILPRPQKSFDPFNPFPRPGPRPMYPIYV